MRRFSAISGFMLVAAFCLAATGCGAEPAEAPAAAPTPVTVSYPVQEVVTDYADFTGRTAAVETVEVRARVWGYLNKVRFKEGALVKKGELLFEIDPRTYRTALANTEGNLASAKAKLFRLNADLDRARQLVQTKAIATQEYDKAAGDRAEAGASLDALKAAVAQAKLDLGFTKVRAPISGRISRAAVTEGNLIAAGPTGGSVLTTIVSVDPIYAYFDVDERTVQNVRRLIREGKAKSARDVALPIRLGLATDQGNPHEGTIDFIDNQVNPKTGTLRVRGLFRNKDEVLSPGFFVRIRVPIGFPHQALLISDRAVDTDQGQKIVYVVDQDKKVATRPIRLGSKQNGLRVIEDGLKADDQVIVVGLQLVRPGALVEPKLVPMPHGSQKPANE